MNPAAEQTVEGTTITSPSRRIGLIKCDDIDGHIEPETGTKESLFIRPLTQLDPNLQFEVYDARHSCLPEDIHTFHGFLITGSRHDAFSDEPWVARLRDWIPSAYDSGAKMVGVCFGHQILAHTLNNGRTERSEKGWSMGTTQPTIINRQPWMHSDDGSDQFCVYVSHQDQVKHLPQGSELIATTDFCPNFMFQLNQQAMGIQGHPEFCRGILRANRQNQPANTP